MGPGVIAVQGRRYVFELIGAWKADRAPEVDMTVDVEFTAEGRVAAIYHVTEFRLARERALQAIERAREKGLANASDMLARFDVPTVIAIGALAAGWIFLDALSVQSSSTEWRDISFWNLLGVVNYPRNPINVIGYGRSNAAGMYGFLAIAALVAPLAPYFWKDRHAYLGHLLPLVFMLYVGMTIYSGMHDSAWQAQGTMSTFGGARTAEMATVMTAAAAKEALKVVSVGTGTYLSVATSIYLAAKGMIKFLPTRA